FGLYSLAEGVITVNGKTVNLDSPHTAMEYGIALCPEDRKTDGIFYELSVQENIIMALQALTGVMHKISYTNQKKLVEEFVSKLEIKVADVNQSVRTLSGGNQQKVILARWLAINPELLILDEPTRGIDIGTKIEIQNLMIALAKKQNKSVIFISSEMEELIATCKRLLVFRDKKIIGELNSEHISMQNIMNAIAGGANED
ncbi:MAG: sugar ABC transporter ATP-binding protein, partial [Clostridiales bacterium]|nr:sugar ABC transporter ATP-binding protein [Clostridiales bacterium]